jgi:hypothetical protein
MIKPDAADFMDMMVSFTKMWRPDLMNKISMADVNDLWGHVKQMYENAEKREPLRSVVASSSDHDRSDDS